MRERRGWVAGGWKKCGAGEDGWCRRDGAAQVVEEGEGCCERNELLGRWSREGPWVFGGWLGSGGAA